MRSVVNEPAPARRSHTVFSSLRAIGTSLSDAVRLIRPYFSSEERPVAWGLLLAIIALNLFTVYLNVVLTYWYKIAYDALQTKSAPTFWASMFTYRVVDGFPYFVPGFCEIATVLIVASVYAFYLNQMLQIRCRRWLTIKFVADWFDRRAYYQISLQSTGTPLDNPDQRIADDLADFVASNLTLGVSLLTNVVTLLSFVGVLWSISPPLVIGHLRIPGYLVWAALLYSIAGTYLTHLIGRPLIPLSFAQQRYNADFRFGLVRVRENAEQIALYHGEREEQHGLIERFAAIYTNWWAIMKRTRSLNFFTIGFSQIAIVFPLVVAAPEYFRGVFALGVLMQIGSIFGNVQGALSWFVTSYPDLVDWRATVQRLDGFERAMHEARRRAESPELSVTSGAQALAAHDLEIDLPNGQRLLRQKKLELIPGDPIALTGPSGVGKSTLFRVFAGIWPFGHGKLELPTGPLMFLPQRPYVPLGTLKHAVVYPMNEGEVSDEQVDAALASVGLGALGAQLSEIDNWALRLSGGEQQRLALARALLRAPAWLFLDEAMSALEESEAVALLQLLGRRLPATQIVSITHSATLAASHARQATIRADASGDAISPDEPKSAGVIATS